MPKLCSFFYSILALIVLSNAAHSQDFVGSSACASCHQEAYDNWQESHHWHAMEEASVDSVLGDFDNANFEYFGTTTRFYTRDGDYFVETDNSRGDLEEFKISYTFGFFPLQQYLVEFPDGRLQTLSISWDSRPQQEGGQRWYHLYSDDQIVADDILHWTGVFQNWNSRCASCHLTDLKKNYSLETNTYQTSWSEMNVGCEACHGAGSQHIEWASGVSTLENKGLLFNLDKVWEPLAGQLQIPDSVDFSISKQVQVCAGCHSRRGELQTRDIAADFSDNYALSPLQQGLYHPDGQILDEVYVVGSFLQSKMHQNSVSCTNCHEPHTNKLKIEGNGLCLQCHAAQTFQNQGHFFHEVDSTGAQCVNCHMPTTTYMGVDDRRDHAFKIPDPLASLELGTPNACTQCHLDQTDQWAADFLLETQGINSMRSQHGAIVAKARSGDSSIAPDLLELATDESNSVMLRSIALIESERFPSQRNLRAILSALNSDDPIIRANAVAGLGFLDPNARLDYLQSHLEDPIKAVRMAVARQLLSLPLNQVSSGSRVSFNALLEEYEQSLLFNADMPEQMSDLGIFYATRGELDAAARALLHALELSPSYLPAMINLSDIYRAQGRDDLGEVVLNDAVTQYPESGDANYALGILYVRTSRTAQAVTHFRRASALNPNNPQYLYIYGVALAETGDLAGAIDVLEGAQRVFPNNPEFGEAIQAYRRL